MSAQNPFTAAASKTRESVFGQKTLTQSQQSSWKQVFSPFAFGLIGLAIAVALWGFGYKLSLYRRHTTPSSQIPVAKLWIESRNASVVATSRLKAKSHHIPVSQAFPKQIQWLPRLGRAVACILPSCRYGVTYFDFLIPFRSPPPHRSCTA